MTVKVLDKPGAKPLSKYSRADLEAGDRLLRAIKEKIIKEDGRIDCDDLKERGYSEEMIARLKEL